MVNLYPMKMKPEPKKIIWGGDRLKKNYNKTAPFDKIAESWELTVRDDGMNIIENGVCKGMTLGEYIEKYGNDVIGKNYTGDRFPLLIKFIDACDRLSIQVHPDDEYSLKNQGEYGKTEMWYIVEADEGAQIVYGLKSDITLGGFRDAVNCGITGGKTEDTLNYVNVKKGDVYFIPSGLVHAIGSGILIAEIQQNSNITYRVYDYDRKQPDGSLRELHTEKALDVVKLYSNSEIAEIQHSNASKTNTSLASCKYFSVDKYDIKDSLSLTAGSESFNSVICIDGSGEIRFGDETYKITKGDSYFIPAETGEYEICGSLEIIVSKI